MWLWFRFALFFLGLRSIKEIGTLGGLSLEIDEVLQAFELWLLFEDEVGNDTPEVAHFILLGKMEVVIKAEVREGLQQR